MRKAYHKQLPLSVRGEHPRSRELAVMGALLDELAPALEPFCLDLAGGRTVDATRGREGLSAEQVLRIGILKQMSNLSYDELAFHLEDSVQLRAFCRLSASAKSPKRASLHANLSVIQPETWAAVNKTLLLGARDQKIEDGEWLRADATVVESNIHQPDDSSLLWDSVRVLSRTLQRAQKTFGTVRCNYSRRAKRRHFAIANASTMERRVPLYKDLLKIAKITLSTANEVAAMLRLKGMPLALKYAHELERYFRPVFKVIDQSERRILLGEKVPAAEKIVSIFEPHTDIIRKDRRGTYYGHKVTLATGRSGLILDVVIEDGNPADSTLAVRAVESHMETFGAPPERVVFDGGFASKQNLLDIKNAGTTEVCFSKPCGIPLDQMTSTPSIRRTLKRFRAGIEAGISFVKRNFGLDRVTWSGLPHFRAYVWCSTVAHNLLLFARRLIAKAA